MYDYMLYGMFYIVYILHIIMILLFLMALLKTTYYKTKQPKRQGPRSYICI